MAMALHCLRHRRRSQSRSTRHQRSLPSSRLPTMPRSDCARIADDQSLARQPGLEAARSRQQSEGEGDNDERPRHARQRGATSGGDACRADERGRRQRRAPAEALATDRGAIRTSAASIARGAQTSVWRWSFDRAGCVQHVNTSMIVVCICCSVANVSTVRCCGIAIVDDCRDFENREPSCLDRTLVERSATLPVRCGRVGAPRLGAHAGMCAFLFCSMYTLTASG